MKEYEHQTTKGHTKGIYHQDTWADAGMENSGAEGKDQSSEGQAQKRINIFREERADSNQASTGLKKEGAEREVSARTELMRVYKDSFEINLVKNELMLQRKSLVRKEGLS